jgi:predicted metal-dependent hydrolase
MELPPGHLARPLSLWSCFQRPFWPARTSLNGGVFGPYLTKRTAVLARKHGFTFGRIFVRAQRNQWGNCSASCNVSLNWRLVMAPRYVSDYLILHELMHTRIMNHTHRFWVHLKAICPGLKDAISWLEANRCP